MVLDSSNSTGARQFVSKVVKLRSSYSLNVLKKINLVTRLFFLSFCFLSESGFKCQYKDDKKKIETKIKKR